MQNIIAQTRQKLGGYLGGAPDLPLASSAFSTAVNSVPVQSFSRFARKLPKQNYQELARLVPISWL